MDAHSVHHATEIRLNANSRVFLTNHMKRRCLRRSLWRNRSARSAVNREDGGSSPPRDGWRFVLWDVAAHLMSIFWHFVPWSLHHASAPPFFTLWLRRPQMCWLSSYHMPWQDWAAILYFFQTRACITLRKDWMTLPMSFDSIQKWT